MRLSRLMALAIVATGVFASPAAAKGPASSAVPWLRVEVVARYPHDPKAYTQGLLLDGERLFESTGQYGQSRLREVALETGRVLREHALPDDLFGEGLAQVGDRLVQLTWRRGLAITYDRDTFAERERHRYEGEGWGLCHDGTRLVMSDGSDRLTLRDPETFAVQDVVAVNVAGQSLHRLNELECVGGLVYANVWRTDRIAVIDPTSGRVTAMIDASGLLSAAERRGTDVLNGIAYRAGRGTFLLTGKYWPRLFEVRFAPR